MENETCKIGPSSPKPPFSLPLTVFDIYFFKFSPGELIFHYALTDASSHNFSSIVLPQLKHSLSLTLDHFLPFAGRLVWPQNEPKPLLLYQPNDGVTLTVAKPLNPDAFVVNTGDDLVKANELRLLAPGLPNSDEETEALSIQITFFENYGVVIGVSAHHALCDGVTISVFMKAWAASNAGISPLPDELIPSFDRAFDKDYEDEYSELLPWWYNGNHPWSGISDQPKSLKLFPRSTLAPSLVRKTFNISASEAEKLKRFVQKHETDSEPLHVSTVMALHALAIMCILKANKVEKTSLIIIPADHRGRVGLPGNYFGNCVVNALRKIGAEDVLKTQCGETEDGLVKISKEVSDIMKDLKRMSFRDSLEATYFGSSMRGPVEVFTLALSPRFGLYKVDFGWGRPLKVDITLESKGNVCILDRRDSDGVQLQLLLEEHLVYDYSSLFAKGLQLEISQNGN